LRPLVGSDINDLLPLFDRDPVAHCFIEGRTRIAGLDPYRLGGEVWGFHRDNVLESAFYYGANLVPIETTAAARAAFADHARRTPRRCSSIVGNADEVLDLWRLLEPAWGRAREVRDEQLLLVHDREPNVESDPLVRYATATDVDVLFPACVEMFSEEVGVSPLAGGAGSLYRARVADLVREKRSFVRLAGDTVEFKAEVGAASTHACQIQGVWVPPHLRGRGISLGGIAAVVRAAQRDVAPVVSLYVNSYNTPARKCYSRVGFHRHGTFATILF
jgi:predicted GNAT family acetyltransferase